MKPYAIEIRLTWPTYEKDMKGVWQSWKRYQTLKGVLDALKYFQSLPVDHFGSAIHNTDENIYHISHVDYRIVHKND